MRRRWIAALAVAAVVVAGGGAAIARELAGGSGGSGPCALPGSQAREAGAAVPAAARPQLSRVVVIVMENKECGEIIGSDRAPYLNRLARQGAFASSWFGVTHPSLPNYLAMIGGSTFGIDSDCTDCQLAATSLVDQLEQAGISWKAYMEGMPSPCFKGASAGTYAKKHNPFMYYDRVANDPGRCGKVVPLGRLSADLAAGKLPAFSFVSPDLCNDMHDCGVRTGDAFLAGLGPRILRALGPHGLLVVTWDEGTSDRGCCGTEGGGNIATIFAGPAARAGTTSTATLTHYSLLRTIEDAWGLPRLRAAASARPATSLLAPPG
jgi:hypothetical protein